MLTSLILTTVSVLMSVCTCFRPAFEEGAFHVCGGPCRPIDLSTIKKNIELGVTRSTAEFQRDVLLMFLNSVMYNKSSHFVHQMARQMQQEGMQHVQVSCRHLLLT